MATLYPTAVWEQGRNRSIDKHSITRPQELVEAVMRERELIKYEGIWRTFNKESISLLTMRKKLEICEQELLKQNLSIMSCNSQHSDSITTLLHLFHLFSVSGQEESCLYHIYNDNIDQLMTRNSIVSEEDLCIRKIDLYYEFQLKLCYGEKLIKQEKYKQYREFMLKNKDFDMSTIKEMKARKDYMTMSKSCIFLLHMLNIDKSRLHPGGVLNQEDLICLLSDLLDMLPEANFYGTFKVYFEHVEMVNLAMRFEFMCTSFGRINPHLKLKFMLSYCEHLIKHKHYHLYRKWMIQCLPCFLDSRQENRLSNECNNPCDQRNNQWNNEEYRIRKLTSLLSRLLYMLPEEILYETISNYLFLITFMKWDIVPKYLHSAKTDPYLKLLFKLFWWKKLIKEGHAESNLVGRCLNDYCREKCRDNRAEFIARIMSIIDNLSEKSLLKELLQCYLRKNLKTVTSMATTEHGHERCEYNKEIKYTQNMSKQSLIYTQFASIFSGIRMRNVDTNQYLRRLNIKGPENENEAETQSEQVKLLILFILLLLLTALGHKSAKLKKYLALKYEYHMASLYLLWCSGDIEVHPGPTWRRKQLEHNSEQKRKWLQDINSILLKLYFEIPTQSKPKNLWQKDNQPEQWPSDKPFYDTKNASKDAEGNKITEDEILTCLLECLKKKEVDIPQIYQSEISAWTNKNIQLLHKLQVFRIEMEKVKSASFTLFLSNFEDDEKNLQNIKVSLKNPTLDKKQTEGLLNNDLRQKKQAELVAEITRDLANTLCRLAKGTDPMVKGDGIWNTPPVNWPDDVQFFNPKNRGKNKDKLKCPDTVLVCTFLKLQYLRIPENLKQIVDAYQTMYIDVKKKNKDELCRLYTIQSNLAKLDCSLHNLHKEGLFSREVNAMLNQWWKTQSVDEHAEHVLKSAMVRSDERPYITINITKKNEQDTDLRFISYTIPITDAFLHIKCTTVHQDQSSQEQTITGSLITVKSPQNIEDSVIPPDIIDFVLEHGFVNQAKCPNDNSVMHTDNGHMSFDLQRQGTPLPLTHQHLKPHNDLDILTTHNTLASDLNGSRCTSVYYTTCTQGCYSRYSSNNRTGENLSGNMGTSKVKRKHLQDKEELVKKLLKTKVNQRNGLSIEQNPNSTSNLRELCSDNVLDSWSLDFSMADRNNANSLGATCDCKNSEDILSCKQMCHLENLVHQNQQYLQNIDGVKNNDKQNDQIEDDEELESFSDLDNFISGKPSQIETDLL